MQLPTERGKIERINPKRMIIYSKPKAGKTSLVSELDSCLLVDLEKGSGFVSAMKVEVNTIAELRELGTAIKEAGHPYKRVAIDTATALEDLAKPLAITLYKKTPMGAKYDGDNVLTLPNGAGYLYLRLAMESLLNYIDTFADEIILLGHLKDKQIELKGKEVSAADIDLTGKIRNIVCAKADAIGYLRREEDQTIISFKTSDTIICGARPEHLKNQEIVIAEMIDGKYVTYWDKIYK